MRIYVGNLPFKTVDEELMELFRHHGGVLQADVIRYKKSGRSKGYGFVIMEDESGQKAIEALNGFKYEGRVLKVNIAKDRKNYPSEERTSQVANLRFAID